MTDPSPVSPPPDVELWLAAFAAAVRDRDYAAARELFDVDAVGFGTVAGRYTGVDQLEQEQWRDVWGRTSGFSFELDSAVCWPADGMALAVSGWSSIGVDSADARPRRGRATFALVPSGTGLLAVHSHFSMDPGTLA